MKNKRIWIILLMGWMISLAPAAEEELNTDHMAPQEMLKARLDKVLLVLQQKDTDPNQKAVRIEHIVTPMFDFQIMAKLTLRSHWNEMTEDQQKQFTGLFIQRLRESYRAKLVLYSNEKVVYQDPISKGKTVTVPTELVSKERKVAVIYRFRQLDKVWKIFDVEIEGVSLIRSYISQFNDIIQKKGTEGLLEELKRPEPKESASETPSN